MPEAFRHHARYDADASRIEMHLVPARRQTAYLRDVDLTVEVAAGESIWTESSYKFTRETVEAMLTASGLGLDRWYSDGQFALAVAAPRA